MEGIGCGPESIASMIGGHIEHKKDAENAYHERFAIIAQKIREIVEK
ncbi:hypothetical protein Mpt1_c05570 [Candidatus Methanoplasma termitum]|uniref:Uncharacterized protein n=1 Tax=Candidatus Methanoplasma termitum TaxID=1577791 RepID=A0A0A7LDP5_9ARCH|nr:hypothetical protein [Candidatus Methanoplasma termitum]AIZ56447.1 hypothetical protein Mpt1_c05570 [Candidatus Methanoplasma termitum]